MIVSIDARGGRVSVSGWQETHGAAGRGRHRVAAAPRRALVRLLERRPRRDARRASTSTRCSGSPSVVRGRFIYSGGIGTLDDLRALAALRQVNLGGVIVGKALYEGRFTVAEGQSALKGR